jgi:hypothetical protein
MTDDFVVINVFFFIWDELEAFSKVDMSWNECLNEKWFSLNNNRWYRLFWKSFKFQIKKWSKNLISPHLLSFQSCFDPEMYVNWRNKFLFQFHFLIQKAMRKYQNMNLNQKIK